MQMSQEEWEKSVTWVGIIAGSVIKKDDKYLMVQEGQERVRGLWNVPAGYVDKDEQIEQAAVREAREETGYEIELDDSVALYHEDAKRPVKHIYRAHIIGGEQKIQEGEILNVKWFTFDEIKALNDQGKIRAEWIFDAIRKVEA